MNNQDFWWRLALLTTLVKKAPHQTLGRTAIVKMAYFLQVLRGVPLGYDFRLYTYGPFDSQVLSDLEYAQALKAVEARTVLFSGGYRYDVCPGPSATAVEAQASDRLAQHLSNIEWVIEQFGRYTASELELFSTIVYVDRELGAQGQTDVSVDELVRRVREVKPHFTEAQVAILIREGQAKGYLKTLVRSHLSSGTT